MDLKLYLESVFSGCKSCGKFGQILDARNIECALPNGYDVIRRLTGNYVTKEVILC